MSDKSDKLLVEYAKNMAKLRRVKKAIRILVTPAVVWADREVDLSKYRESFLAGEYNVWSGWRDALDDWYVAEGDSPTLNEYILAWLLDKKKSLIAAGGQTKRNIFAHGESMRRRME